ncbi:hypothetical protein ABE424_03610 [Stenotrophomonas sp. TWI1149]|uniref:hypothetical protein n=1 Tax=unclassified Stenotrophomonas TaxID=196198 RepID=UPI003209A1DD
MSTETVAGKYAQTQEDVCIRFGIVSALENSHFLAYMAVEPQGVSRVRENLGYSAPQRLKVFPGRNGLKTLAQGGEGSVAGGRNANLPRCLELREHWNPQRDDGARFSCPSLIHYTGRANVTAYSQAIYGEDGVARSQRAG